MAKRLDVRVSVLIRAYTQMSDARIDDISGPGWARLQLDESGQWRAFATQQGRLRSWEYFERVRAARQKAPDMASICNDEQGAFGVMSGHDRKTLSL
ncbi:MAG: hypothetical protein JF606_16670 [Burkholderiales bacterium]|nr:hypothetical protein [Burkholderiales bacterium]